MLLPAFFILITAVCGQQEASQEASPDQVAQLIEQLGDQKFTVRQSATLRLRSIGRPAIPALRKALQSPKPEVRNRAESVLGFVLGTVARTAFLKDPTLVNAKKLLSWPRLRKLVESDEDAVKQMKVWLKAEPRLFEASVIAGDDLTRQLRDRASRLSDFKQRPSETSPELEAELLASITAIVFIANDPQTKLSRDAMTSVESVFDLAVAKRALSPQVRNDQLMRTLTGVWIGGRGSQYKKLLLTLKYSLPEGLPLAESIIRSKARGARMEYALHIVGKLGGEKQVKLLESQLSNTTRLSSPRVRAVQKGDRGRLVTRYEYQVRDVSLGMLWHLHGENPADHGFDPKRVSPHRWYGLDLHCLGFTSDDQRLKAHAEWKTFATDRTPIESRKN